MTVAGSSIGEVVLHVEDVHLELGNNTILDGVTLEVKDRIRLEAVTGQVVAILGPSGVGKTRLLRIIAGLDAPDKGKVYGLKKQALVPGTVGVVFQDYPLLKHRTAESNLLLAGSIRGLTADKAKARCQELLAKFGLEERASFYPAQLSGGQRQRLAIAQQLVVPTPLLLLDEPFSGLDPVALEEVGKLIIDVANMDEFNTLVVVTHDIRAAMSVSDTLFMLGRRSTEDGKKKLPGAKIVAEYDLVERDLAWQPGLLQDPRFVALEKEVREKFRAL